tara:strand:- start:2657 stop:2968 length:312 start_codon:yes stop_codon:yes gene_type:complete
MQNLMDRTEQILHKVTWENNRYGGRVGKQKPFEKGKDLLRIAKLEEVVPDKEEYFIRPNGAGNDFYLLMKGFDKKVNYEDIKAFVKHKTIYVYKDFNVYGKHK